jgi:putative addiction module killer protein
MSHGSVACAIARPKPASIFGSRRLSLGNPGDVRPVGEGVSELRIRYGPGYRIYFISQGNMLIVLLAGGDKGSQAKDIQHAKDLARNL